MTAGDNNPRVFAETISLDCWRTAFDGERGEADLHIDVVFGDRGRIGGDDSPVRFRLSLKRAEVHVVKDSEGILEIKRGSIMRTSIKMGQASNVIEKKPKFLGAWRQV